MPIVYSERPLLLSLLVGNFVIGTGVMLVPGTLSDIANGLQVSIAAAGQLITAGAITVCIGAPLLAALLASADRRTLLLASMLWYAALHVACALAPNYSSLLLLRVLALVSAAVFTPQAAAVASSLVAPERRGKAITTVFLGWSLASVLGAPLAAWLGGSVGWRASFALLGLLALVSAWLVWRCTPSGVKPSAISADMWKQTLGSKLMRITVLVTVLSATGQFVLFAYFSPYVTQVLKGAPGDLAFLFAVFGVFGVVGSIIVSRVIDHIGPARAVMITLGMMALTMLFWPLGAGIYSLAFVMIPWGLGCFASNSAQQARLVAIAPAMASVGVALNTSAMYLGQGLGAAAGGWLVNQQALAHLHWAALLGMVLAMFASLWAQRELESARH